MSQNGERDRDDETPPYSRIFVVCSKDITEDDLKNAFEKYGEIENLYIPKDRSTGASRGVAYIKYSKTSSAATAIEELHHKSISSSYKPVKVMIASKKNDSRDNQSNEQHDRIFIKVSKQATQDEIEKYFSKFGKVKSVLIVKDRTSHENKGLAYVQYHKFSEAALAIENCESKYKAVFAAPRQDDKRKRGMDDFDSYNGYYQNPMNTGPSSSFDNFSSRSQPRGGNMNIPFYAPPMMNKDVVPLIRSAPQNYRAVIVTCTPNVRPMYLETLFDIIPGMQNVKYNEDSYNGYSQAIVTYEDEKAAAYAVEKLNNYEFPSGELLSVKPHNPLSRAADDLTNILSSFKTAVNKGSPDLLQLADAIAHASTLIKAATSGGVSLPDIEMQQDSPPCNVPLPGIQHLANPNSATAKRCFIVCKPEPPPHHIMQNLFCRFGDLIDVTIFKGKNFGFAKYASEKAANNAIKTLHGATIFNTIYLKVLEAEDPKNKSDMMDTDEGHGDGDRKRIRLDD